MDSGQKKILLGIDLEEFDIPEEYGQSLSVKEKLAVSRTGLAVLEPILQKYHIQATFFTTAFWARQEQVKIQEIARRHEIASHGYFHHIYAPRHLARSRELLSKLSGQEVIGLRMPRMQQLPYAEISGAGYFYDSSLNPTRLPGRYNHMREPRTIFYRDGVYEMPVSVSPFFRIPLFWLSFKNFPFRYYSYLCDKILRETGYLIIYMHPWEFADLSGFRLPWYIKRRSGKDMAERANRLFNQLSSAGEFITHAQMLGIHRVNDLVSL